MNPFNENVRNEFPHLVLNYFGLKSLEAKFEKKKFLKPVTFCYLTFISLNIYLENDSPGWDDVEDISQFD